MAMRTTRRGFTLFQLLVVLALLLIVVALLLPAVSKARLAALRAQSVNNLKQMALAAHNYQATFNKLPPGLDANSFSTATYLLPYIEQDNVFKSIDLKKSVDDKANADARKLIIKTFLNPQDKIPAVTPDYGATNYLFSAGSKASLDDNNGVFYRNSKVSLADITDGTSNTMMIGETLKGDNGMRALDVRRQHVKLKKASLKGITNETGVAEWKADKMIAADRCASWMNGQFLQGTFTATRVLNDAKPDVNCEGAGGLSGLRSVQGGVSVAICDGSVRTIAPAVTLEVWKALATRNGGEVLPADF
jgi:type II secretory pathway pseudopilin PulG